MDNKPKENTYYCAWEGIGLRLYYITKVVDNPEYDKDEWQGPKKFRWHVKGKILLTVGNSGTITHWGNNEYFTHIDGFLDIEELMQDISFRLKIIEEFSFSNEDLKELFDRLFK